MSANQKAHWWTTTTHPAGVPLIMDGGKQSQKTPHFLARPIIGPGAQTPHEKILNHTWAHLATAKGPQINTRKGHAVRSRSRAIPVPTIHAVRKIKIFFNKTMDLSGGIYTDQTGRFPVTSSKGNKYILAVYH